MTRGRSIRACSSSEKNVRRSVGSQLRHRVGVFDFEGFVGPLGGYGEEAGADVGFAAVSLVAKQTTVAKPRAYM